jgi:polyhydroxyalkanoate synthesis regulator phasin
LFGGDRYLRWGLLSIMDDKKIDPYKVLKIRRNATKQAIVDAFRKRALAVHPDRGGSAKEFGKVKLAYEILRDDVRKARFDATGEYDDRKADNATAAILADISACLSACVQELVSQGCKPEQRNLVKEMLQSITKRSQTIRENRSDVEGGKAVWEAIAGRFTLERGVNALDDLVRLHIKESDDALAAFDKELEKMATMTEYLRKYGFNVHREDWQQARVTYFTVTNMGSSSSR